MNENDHVTTDPFFYWSFLDLISTKELQNIHKWT